MTSADGSNDVDTFAEVLADVSRWEKEGTAHPEYVPDDATPSAAALAAVRLVLADPPSSLRRCDVWGSDSWGGFSIEHHDGYRVVLLHVLKDGTVRLSVFNGEERSHPVLKWRYEQ